MSSPSSGPWPTYYDIGFPGGGGPESVKDIHFRFATFGFPPLDAGGAPDATITRSSTASRGGYAPERLKGPEEPVTLRIRPLTDLREAQRAPSSCIEDMGMLTVQIDTETEDALAELTSDGRSLADVVRDAIRQAAWRRQEQQAQRDSERLAGDPADRAEAQAIMHDMDDLRAW